MVINRVPGHPPGLEFGMRLPTISPKALPCPSSHFNTYPATILYWGERGEVLEGATKPDFLFVGKPAVLKKY